MSDGTLTRSTVDVQTAHGSEAWVRGSSRDRMGERLREVIEEAWAGRSRHWINYARTFTGNTPEAEEVVQDAVARTLKANPDLPTELRVHRYVLAAVRTSAFSLLRQRRRSSHEQLDAAAPDGTRVSVLTLLVGEEESLEKRRTLERAKAGLKELSDNERQAVELVLLSDPPMKLREVAAIQGITPSAVHYRVKRAVERLADVVSRPQHSPNEIDDE